MPQTTLSSTEFCTVMHDSLMEQIDPRFCTENLDKTRRYLDTCSKRQAKKLIKEFKKAYKEFGRLWEQFHEVTGMIFSDLQSQAMEVLLEKDRKQADQALEDLNNFSA